MSVAMNERISVVTKRQGRCGSPNRPRAIGVNRPYRRSTSMFPIAPPNELRVNIRRFMRLGWLPQFALVGGIAVLFCSCEELPQQIQLPLAAVMPTPAPGWWNDQGARGEARIVVPEIEHRLAEMLDDVGAIKIDVFD